MQKSVAQEFVDEFVQSINITELVAKVNEISQNIDRNAYLSMKICYTCNENFGKNAAKKYFCKFCYKAYCDKCCVLKHLHPETGQNERCCTSCYVTVIRKSVFALVEIFAKEKMNKEVSEREAEERKQQLLLREIERIEKELDEEQKSYSDEIGRIDKVIDKMENQVKEKIMNAIQLRKKVANVVNPPKKNNFLNF